MRIWINIGLVLVAIGAVVVGISIICVGFDMGKLSSVKFTTNTYELTEEFNDISVKTNTAGVKFVASQDEICKVTCYEQEKSKHTVYVENGVLKVDVVDNRKWYDFVSISFKSPQITVSLPEKEYNSLFIKEKTGSIEIPKGFSFVNIDVTVTTGDVKCNANALENIKIKTTTGKIRVEDVSTDLLDLSVTTGDVYLSKINCGNLSVKVSTGDTNVFQTKCKNFTSKGSTGDVYLKNLVATENFWIERSTGDIEFKECDANEIYIITDTGDIEGSLLTPKIFIADSDTGDVDVPKTTTGGKCEVITDTGDIEISICG